MATFSRGCEMTDYDAKALRAAVIAEMQFILDDPKAQPGIQDLRRWIAMLRKAEEGMP
jgi:hypothetical protein